MLEQLKTKQNSDISVKTAIESLITQTATTIEEIEAFIMQLELADRKNAKTTIEIPSMEAITEEIEATLVMQYGAENVKIELAA